MVSQNRSHPARPAARRVRTRERPSRHTPKGEGHNSRGGGHSADGHPLLITSRWPPFLVEENVTTLLDRLKVEDIPLADGARELSQQKAVKEINNYSPPTKEKEKLKPKIFKTEKPLKSKK